MNKIKANGRFACVALLYCCSLFTMTTNAQSPVANNALQLTYDSPAQFFEESLVIGNGRLGGIVYGGTHKDRISLNDITLWTGEPDKQVFAPDAHKAIPDIRAALDREDYRTADKLQHKVQGHYSENYQPLGTLVIDYLDRSGEITDYRRWLDISDATAATRYKVDGKAFASDYFASAPDSVIVIRLKTDDSKGIRAILTLNSLLPHISSAAGNEISMEGYAAYHSLPVYRQNGNSHQYDPERGIHFNTIVRVVAADGEIKSFPTGEVKIDGSSEVMILVANATSFNGFDKNPVSEGLDYKSIVRHRMDAAGNKAFAVLRNAHVADYKSFFDRVELSLGKTDASIASKPTDKQLRDYTEHNQHNPELEALYFQYGRYLLISSSRTPGVPANLQGLWNEKLLPPWSCNYTMNINLEENYWPAEVTNLAEMHMPLMGFVKNLSVTGQTTAKAYYGVEKGWCVAHNSDMWAMSCPVGLHNGHPSWACWNMGGAWVATHIWEHYLFTQDKDFLREYYPVLKGAADFCMNWMIEKDGYLLTSPGTSPENIYLTPDGYAGATLYGSTADLAMSRECIMDAREAARVLNVDKDFVKQADRTLKRMWPYHIGKNGNLQEWYHDWNDKDPRHRHQSHLFGLFPGHHITPAETPDLAGACSRSLEIKGDNTTGWSTGWRVNLYARLRDSKNAYHIYRRLLRYISPDDYKGNDAQRGGGTYPNLLDAHSPFQIDGNFGGCAGVAEMLMQSTAGTITLLPALPDEWKDGHVRGICARGGFVVDMEWRDGRVTSLHVTSRNGGKTTLYFNGQKRTVSLKSGEKRQIL